jgi:asparagine synthase (glutamine-hydrolysing)
MCGIAGIISDNEWIVRQSLPYMLDKLSHRGPGDYGEEITNTGKSTVGLGHRRLSILDLSIAGHQLMIQRGTGSQITFNGEIYSFYALRKRLQAQGVRFIGHSGYIGITSHRIFGLWGDSGTLCVL